MSVQGKEKFQSTAMKISVNDTQVVMKNVWISRIIIHEDTPQKINASYATLSATLWGFPKSTVSSDCQQNSLGTGDTPVQTFYSERERVEPSWIKYQSTGWHWGLPLPIHPVYDYIIISSLRLYLTTKLSFLIKPRNLVIFFSPHH